MTCGGAAAAERVKNLLSWRIWPRRCLRWNIPRHASVSATNGTQDSNARAWLFARPAKTGHSTEPFAPRQVSDRRAVCHPSGCADK